MQLKVNIFLIFKFDSKWYQSFQPCDLISLVFSYDLCSLMIEAKLEVVKKTGKKFWILSKVSKREGKLPSFCLRHEKSLKVDETVWIINPSPQLMISCTAFYDHQLAFLHLWNIWVNHFLQHMKSLAPYFVH